MADDRGIVARFRDVDFRRTIPRAPRCLRARSVPTGRETERLEPEVGRRPFGRPEAHDGAGPPRTLLGSRGARRGLEAVRAVPEGSREPAPGPARTRLRPRRPRGGQVDVRYPVGPRTESRPPRGEGPSPPRPHETPGREAPPGDPPPAPHGCRPLPGRRLGDHECRDEPPKHRTGPCV